MSVGEISAERERERQRERERERISSRLHTSSPEPNAELKLKKLRGYDLSRKQELDSEPSEPPRCPISKHFLGYSESGAWGAQSVKRPSES